MMKNGFVLTFKSAGKEYQINRKVKANIGLHVEYNYFGKGNGFSFSIKHDTYYMYPTSNDVSITKLQFAVEELYKSSK